MPRRVIVAASGFAVALLMVMAPFLPWASSSTGIPLSAGLEYSGDAPRRVLWVGLAGALAWATDAFLHRINRAPGTLVVPLLSLAGAVAVVRSLLLWMDARLDSGGIASAYGVWLAFATAGGFVAVGVAGLLLAVRPQRSPLGAPTPSR